MDDRSVFDVAPQMFGASEKLFTRPRLFLVAAVLITMLVAAVFAG